MNYHSYVQAFSDHAAKQINDILSRGGRIFLVSKYFDFDKECENIKLSLSDIYLLNIHVAQRNKYVCSTCTSFINRYGRMIGILPTGEREVIGWTMPDDLIPDEFKAAHKAVIQAIKNASVVGPFFLPNEKTPKPKEIVFLGDMVKGGHEHLHIKLDNIRFGIISKLGNNEKFNVGAIRDDFNRFVEFIGKTPQDVFKLINTYVNLDKINRKSKFAPLFNNVAKLSEHLKASTAPNKLDLLWLNFMEYYFAFKGFKNTVAGQLITDLVNDRPVNESVKAFNERVDGLHYMRPTAQAEDALIDEAEAFINRNGYDKSIQRRNATIADVEKYIEWQPIKLEEEKESLFSRLKDPKNKKQITYVEGTERITYARFKETILPIAESIEILIPSLCYIGFVTEAVHADAPPIFKYDKLDSRNTLCFCSALNISLKEWGITPNSEVKVAAVIKPPTDENDFWFWILEGVTCNNFGLGHGIFPESLIHEFHQYRKVIEAYSKTTPLHDVDGSSKKSIVGFYMHTAPHEIGLQVTVTLKGNVKKTYVIDRGI